MAVVKVGQVLAIAVALVLAVTIFAKDGGAVEGRTLVEAYEKWAKPSEPDMALYHCDKPPHKSSLGGDKPPHKPPQDGEKPPHKPPHDDEKPPRKPPHKPPHDDDNKRPCPP